MQTKTAADKNWKAAEFPPPSEFCKENEAPSGWLKYLKPSGYNIMMAIENTIKSRSKETLPYWYQANVKNINKPSNSSGDPTRIVPVIDASKKKTQKRMTVRQYLRAAEMSKEELQSYLASDEEPSRAQSEISVISTVTEVGSSSEESRGKWRKQVHRKLPEVLLPDRVTPRYWSKSDTQLHDKYLPLKSRKKLFSHKSKANTRPVNSTENFSRMYSAVAPRKLKQRQYDLIAPNVELRRRIERTRRVENNESDTNTWNSHVTYRQNAESDRRNDMRGISVNLSPQTEDSAAWRSNTAKQQTPLEVRRSDVAHKSSVSKRKVKSNLLTEECVDRHTGKKHEFANERDELQKEEKLSHSTRRVNREKMRDFVNAKGEIGNKIGEPSFLEKGEDERSAPRNMVSQSVSSFYHSHLMLIKIKEQL